MTLDSAFSDALPLAELPEDGFLVVYPEKYEQPACQTCRRTSAEALWLGGHAVRAGAGSCTGLIAGGIKVDKWKRPLWTVGWHRGVSRASHPTPTDPRFSPHTLCLHACLCFQGRPVTAESGQALGTFLSPKGDPPALTFNRTH